MCIAAEVGNKTSVCWRDMCRDGMSRQRAQEAHQFKGTVTANSRSKHHPADITNRSVTESGLSNHQGAAHPLWYTGCHQWQLALLGDDYCGRERAPRQPETLDGKGRPDTGTVQPFDDHLPRAFAPRGELIDRNLVRDSVCLAGWPSIRSQGIGRD